MGALYPIQERERIDKHQSLAVSSVHSIGVLLLIRPQNEDLESQLVGAFQEVFKKEVDYEQI